MVHQRLKGLGLWNKLKEWTERARSGWRQNSPRQNIAHAAPSASDASRRQAGRATSAPVHWRYRNQPPMARSLCQRSGRAALSNKCVDEGQNVTRTDETGYQDKSFHSGLTLCFEAKADSQRTDSNSNKRSDDPSTDFVASRPAATCFRQGDCSISHTADSPQITESRLHTSNLRLRWRRGPLCPFLYFAQGTPGGGRKEDRQRKLAEAWNRCCDRS